MSAPLQQRPAGADTGGVDPGHSERDAVDLLCFRNLLGSASDIVYFKGLDSRYLRVSRGTARSYGLDDPQSQEGRSDADHFAPEHAAAARADELRIIATGEPMVDVEERQLWPDREPTYVSTTKLALRDANGTIVGTFGVSRDITRRVAAEALAQQATEELARSHAALARAEADLRRVLDTTPDAITRYDAQQRFVYLNPTALALGTLTGEQYLGRTVAELGLDPHFTTVWATALDEVLATAARVELEFTLPGAEHDRWFQARLVPETDQDGATVGVLAVTRDLTALKLAEQRLAFAAAHDPLTGLLNRPVLLASMTSALQRMRRRPCVLAVMFIDLDGFKQVNDRLGHEGGDRVLVSVARTLTATCRGSDVVSRFGGDEFVVVCEGLAPDDIDTVVRRVSAALNATDGQVAAGVTASVGVALTTDPDIAPEVLVQRADAAMYVAKRSGGRAWRVDDVLARAGLR